MVAILFLSGNSNADRGIFVLTVLSLFLMILDEVCIDFLRFVVPNSERSADILGFIARVLDMICR